MHTYLIHKEFQKIASIFPKKPALLFQKDNNFLNLTFKDVLDYSQRIGFFIRGCKIRFGEKIALYMENSPFWFPTYLGIVSLGCVCVPIDYQLTRKEVENILIDSEAKLIFCSHEAFKKIENITKDFLKCLEIVVIDFKFLENFKAKVSPSSDFREDSLASLLYTSGTTDNPKAVMLSHKNFMSNFYSIRKLGIYTSKDIFLCILPLHHAYPFTVNLLVPLLSGCSVIFPESLRGEDILFCLKQGRVSIFVGVPQVFSLLYQELHKKLYLLKPLINFLGAIRKVTNINVSRVFFSFLHKKFSRKLRYMVSGGAKLDKEIAQEFFNLGFNILEGYGLTETSPVVSINPPSKIKIGSVGRALPDVKLRIDNPDSSGIGEVLVKGDNVTLGYFRKPNLTEKFIKDGWFYTKDIGFIDEDNYLYITGRKDECIVLSSGKNIWPEELEKIYQDKPSIKEVCIFKKRDSLYAVVVPEQIYFLGKKKADIYEEIKKDIEETSLQIPSYKRISGFSLEYGELPRTRLGKLKRFLISKLYSEEIPEEKKVEEEDEFSQNIISLIENFLNKKVSIKDNLELDLGVDSLKRLQLVSLLEKRFNIKIPDEDLYKMLRVEDIINYIRSKEPVYYGESMDYKGISWSQILGEKPNLKLMRRIRLDPLFLDIILSFLSKVILLFIFKVLYRVKIKGLANLPQEGPFLICPNHTSYLDGLLVFATFPFKSIFNLFFMGLTDYFEHPLLSWLVKPGRIIPINANKNLKEALRLSSLLLKEGKILCIFPEGRRSWDGKLKEFKKGVGILAKELNIKIVPVAIKGTHLAWPPSKKFPRLWKLQIIYGKPIKPEKIREDSEVGAYQEIVNSLKNNIISLLSFDKFRNK